MTYDSLLQALVDTAQALLPRRIRNASGRETTSGVEETAQGFLPNRARMPAHGTDRGTLLLRDKALKAAAREGHSTEMPSLVEIDRQRKEQARKSR